ncbi:putative metallo-dependent phosphatase [Thermacetogenium phaeum DSM 12270]|uniref:Putative metallo-dependent phosphatase n=1 Tax=Thermacetogenium phaeum (strain ATCC BAA-254 / DSM 26808 / PB) TaxID=1089553 RepID=K4LHX7_THEPS|nr:metallo-dependent phosphatase [Thermacetogenium phaeum]AFV11667.1 putative metallo-dependent phosphatase [Thermacetogenium phaeum DSM 12270]
MRITEADYTLTGHYHLPFEISDGEKRVVNPGALVRLSVIQEEIDRTPSVMLIECSQSGISHRIIPLACAKPGSEALDRSHLDIERLRDERRQAFLTSLDEFRGDRFAALEPEKVLNEVLSHFQASPEVQGEVWRRFQEIMSSQ